MNPNPVLQHFEELSNCIFQKYYGGQNLKGREARRMAVFTGDLVRFAWNYSTIANTLAGVRTKIIEFCEKNRIHDPFQQMLFDAAELKWREYRQDRKLIESTAVTTRSNQPYITGTVKSDPADPAGLLHQLLHSPENEARLKNLSPEQFEAEVGRIIAEYNARMDAEKPSAPGLQENSFTVGYLRKFLMEYWRWPDARRQQAEEAFRTEQPDLWNMIGDLNGKAGLSPERYTALRDMLIAYYTAACSIFPMDRIFPEEVRKSREELRKLGSRPRSKVSDDMGPCGFIDQELDKLNISGSSADGKELRLQVHAITVVIAIRLIEKDMALKGEMAPDDEEYPCSYVTLLDCFYNVLEKQSAKEKRIMLRKLQKKMPFLTELCGPADQAEFYLPEPENPKAPGPNGSVADLALTVFQAYGRDPDLTQCSKAAFDDRAPDARMLMDELEAGNTAFEEMTREFPEPDLLQFIADILRDMRLPEQKYQQSLLTMLTWGMSIGYARFSANQSRYNMEDEEKSSGPEKYDFDPKNLHLLYLHVKLRGFRVSVDITVPEDATFAALHTVLNSVFERDDDHLYRFECQDGCTVVCREEELRDEIDAVLADQCYIGHHLKKDCGAYYLFDYGDNWEHDITVRKVTASDPEHCHFEVLKITGCIPEQYPDEEDDE